MPAVAGDGDGSGPAGPDAVALARDRFDRLAAGLPRALLASAACDVRAVAARAAEAEARLARRRARLGDRPALDEGAARRAEDARAGYRRAGAGHRRTVADGHRLLALGNGVGVGCLAVAALLQAAGVELTAPPVTAAVLAAAGGPVGAVALGLRRRRASSRALAAARGDWAAALEATGLATMGALAARRLAVEAWDRRRRELDVVAETARRRRRRWQVLAGPGAAPQDVERLLARLQALRAAQLGLLAALLARRTYGPAAGGGRAGPAQPAGGAGPPRLQAPPPVAAAPPGGPAAPASRLDEVLERLRSGRLRLWAFRTGP